MKDRSGPVGDRFQTEKASRGRCMKIAVAVSCLEMNTCTQKMNGKCDKRSDSPVPTEMRLLWKERGHAAPFLSEEGAQLSPPKRGKTLPRMLNAGFQPNSRCLCDTVPPNQLSLRQQTSHPVDGTREVEISETACCCGSLNYIAKSIYQERVLISHHICQT